MFKNGRIMIALGFVLLSGTSACAETIYVEPSGEYATIDTKATNEATRAMLHGTKEERDKVAAEVLKAPDKYAPPALYVLAHVLFADGKKDDAAFWFYAGQLRSRSDGALCTDRSAQSGTSVLNYQFGSEINQYTFQRLDQLKALVPKVVEWDRTIPHNYDRRWMALHGMGGFMNQDKTSPPIVIPKSDWEKSDETVRAEYLEGFKQAMAEMANRQKEADKKQSSP